MSSSPEAVLRKLLSAYEQDDVDTIMSLFSEDSLYIDGPLGTYEGKDAIKSAFERQFAYGLTNKSLVVTNLLASDRTVMIERADSFDLGGHRFTTESMAVLEFEADGRIIRWRDYFDLKTARDQMAAAGVSISA